MPVISSNRFLPPSKSLEDVLTNVVAAEDAVARLDERLFKSSIRQAWIERSHYLDAVACMWNEGELVHTEDLVLHEAGMDVHLPTRELSRAIGVIRTRRQIMSEGPQWALTIEGLSALRGKGRVESALPHSTSDLLSAEDREYLAIDRSIERAERALRDVEQKDSIRDPLIYDPHWDEESRLEIWRNLVSQCDGLPPTLAVAVCINAWNEIEPLQHLAWLGGLLSAAIFRARAKTRSHLFCLNLGERLIDREKPRSRDLTTQLAWRLKAMKVGAEFGLKEHERWLTASGLLQRKLRDRRSTSRLSEVIDLVLSRPLISAGIVSKELKITSRAAQALIGQLDLRETTGRSRYRAWTLL